MIFFLSILGKLISKGGDKRLPSKVSKCMVQECQYNKDFDCMAEGIEVKSQKNAMTSGVSSSSHTLCETFAPKGQSADIPDTSTFS